MIECIFTVDYELYGNGQGSLAQLVYEPAEALKRVFDRAGAKFVVFVEVAELEKIAMAQTDPAIRNVERQIREFHVQGFEIALHLHSQWCDASNQEGNWKLNYSEYNLCTMPKARIAEIVDRSLAWLRGVLGVPEFTPLSFRAGNWLFQPTATAAEVLSERGIRIDSSVFKGGLFHRHNLDYRPASRNGYYWNFEQDVSRADDNGAMLEVPIYTRMVPFWRMLTGKRARLQGKSNRAARQTQSPNAPGRMSRFRDYLRFRYPLKFDFCRMTLAELIEMVESVIQEGRQGPGTVRPLVAIGHTKDLVDVETVQAFLGYLKERRIAVSTLREVYPKCR
jgi:hypothetical protein